MQRLILLFVILCNAASGLRAQCSAGFLAIVSGEYVTFSSQTNVPDAYYFWNFGDGTSSRARYPVHTFPGTGDYFVSMFVRDAAGNCSAFHEEWVHVTKAFAGNCKPQISDSLFTSGGQQQYVVVDRSANCDTGYSQTYDYVGAQNFHQPYITTLEPWGKIRFLSRAKYYRHFAPPGELAGTAYKSLAYRYSGSKNYNPCSANFEFYPVASDPGGERYMFRAMNTNAQSYAWTITGFGEPILAFKDTVSQFYVRSEVLWMVSLSVMEANGCRDTLTQMIRMDGEPTVALDVAPGPMQQTAIARPNPFRTVTNLEIPEAGATLVVYNSIGSLVRRFEHLPLGNLTLQRDALPAGVYYFRITGRTITACGRLVAE